MRDALLMWLARSAANILVIDLQDLWLEELPQNVPGTSSDWLNWRRKLRLSLEAMAERAEIDQLLSQVHRARNGVSHNVSVAAANLNHPLSVTPSEPQP